MNPMTDTPTDAPRDRRWGPRCLAIVAVVMLCIALFAPVALAGKPDRVRLGPFEPFVDPPGLVCPEAIAPEGVRTSYVGGSQVLTVFDDGRLMITGSLTEEITNVATGKSVVLDTHGRFVSVPLPDGGEKWQLSGTKGLVFFPGDVGPGDDATGRDYIFTGKVEVVLDADFSIIAFESAGKMKDVCAMIA